MRFCIVSGSKHIDVWEVLHKRSIDVYLGLQYLNIIYKSIDVCIVPIPKEGLPHTESSIKSIN